MQTLGVLGGLGPAATARFYMAVMQLFQLREGARLISDYPHVVINSVPLPAGPMSASASRMQLIDVLQDSCRLLEQAGANFIAIPCNSVHAAIKPMRRSVSVPVLSLIEQTLDAAERQQVQRLGLLSTRFTHQRQLYSRPASARGLELLTPSQEQQAAVDALIIRANAGALTPQDSPLLEDMVEGLARRGAQAVVLGCTELPLVPLDTQVPTIDTLEVLAEACWSRLTQRG